MNWLSVGLALFGLFCALVVLPWCLSANYRRRVGVAKLVEESEIVHENGFRWCFAELKSIRNLDFGFYAKVSKEMGNLGFQILGDVEYLHVSETYPNMRTGVRTFGSDDGVVSGAVYHVPVRGLAGIVACFTMGTRNIKSIEFQTLLGDGRWIITNTLGAVNCMSSHEKIMKYQYSSSISARRLFQLHQFNVRQFTDESDDCILVRAHTLKEVMGLEALQYGIEQEHRKKMGMFTKEEFAQICPDLPSRGHVKLLGEVDRQSASAA